MQPLASSYLVELARQLAFLSAVLGGFAATFLATLVAVDARRPAAWVVGLAAAAACGFIVTVVASVAITVVLHPNAPAAVVRSTSVGTARVVSGASFSVGLLALLGAIGLSGWIRSRRVGLATTSTALVGIVLVFWAIGGFR